MGSGRRHVLTRPSPWWLASLALALAPSLVRGAPPDAAAPRPSASAPVLPASSTPPAASSEPPEPAAPEATEGGNAENAGEAAILWPTVTPLGDGVSAGPLRRPEPGDAGLVERARALDQALSEAAQDLGLSLDVGGRGPALPRAYRDSELIEEARERNSWILSPRLEREGGELILRLVAVPPGSGMLLVREERVAPGRVAVRGVVMLRELLRSRAHAKQAPARTRDEAPEPREKYRTSGRAVLLGSLAVFGGYAGYALHTSSRGDDPRLLYPLMALGAGVGLGAAAIAADEWDLSTGNAWFLSAGATWPVAATLLFSAGYDVQPRTDAHAFGLIAGIGGLGVSTGVLARRNVGEGGALLAHSGAIWGGGLGGLVEMMAAGSTQDTPLRGLGYGMSIGWLTGSVAGAWVEPSAGRVLRVGLGAGLGALGGAAAASPLLLEDPGKTQERLWLGAVGLGGAVGAGVGAWLSVGEKGVGKAVGLLPAPGVVAATRRAGGEVRPVMGLTWSGRW